MCGGGGGEKGGGDTGGTTIIGGGETGGTTTTVGGGGDTGGKKAVAVGQKTVNGIAVRVTVGNILFHFFLRLAAITLSSATIHSLALASITQQMQRPQVNANTFRECNAFLENLRGF